MTVEELNTQVQNIMEFNIRPIDDAAKQAKIPFTQKITELEESFLDELLKDKNGEVVKSGMTLKDEKGTLFLVENRYQQCIFQYLGNAQVVLAPLGKPCKIKVGYRSLNEYEIVQI